MKEVDVYMVVGVVDGFFADWGNKLTYYAIFIELTETPCNKLRLEFAHADKYTNTSIGFP